jgi:hypothetical protein
MLQVCSYEKKLEEIKRKREEMGGFILYAA